MSKVSLSKIHQQVSQIMLPINRLLVKQFSLPKKISYKAGGVDHLGTSIVTETDPAVEKILKAKLAKILPGSGFIGEETPPLASGGVKAYNWIVDPIDGTLNFANQVPVFACSVALWQQNKPIYAYVSLPMSQEVVHAVNGQGIYLNSQSFKSSTEPAQKLFITYSCVGSREEQSRIFQTILQFTSSPRSYGSCVFHGLEIALGRIGAGVFINQALWDIGAIVLLAKEAGLAVNYISPPPNIQRDDLKNYQYSLVIGPEKLAYDLAVKIKS